MAYILRKDVRVAEKVHLCMITKGNFTANFQARVGLSNILYSERFKEGSKFFFGREPGQGAHR